MKPPFREVINYQTYNSRYRFRSLRSRTSGYSDLRDLVSPTSSGDEKDFRSTKSKADSGLSEDHGSTGSSGSNNPTENNHGEARIHQNTSGYNRNKHFLAGNSTKPDKAFDKVRRSSTDSARSSTHHDDLGTSPMSTLHKCT